MSQLQAPTVFFFRHTGAQPVVIGESGLCIIAFTRNQMYEYPTLPAGTYLIDPSKEMREWPVALSFVRHDQRDAFMKMSAETRSYIISRAEAAETLRVRR